MRKKTILVASGIATALMCVFLLMAYSTLQGIVAPQPMTHESVFESDSLLRAYGLTQKKSPFDYGFDKVTELQFASVTDGAKLSGWLTIPETNTNKCLIICHKPGENRLAALRYLAILQTQNLQNDFFVLLPDLRNAGSSDAGPQLLGFQAAEDITSAMMLLNQQYQITDFTLMGTGESALACVLASRRRDLLYRLNYLGINVEKIILDSPYSNAKKILERQLADLNPIRRRLALWLFDRKVDGYLEKMSFAVLMQDVGAQILVLQNIGDEVAATDILLQELPKKPNIELQLFDGDKHAGIFLDPFYQKRYSQEISDLLQAE